MKQENVQAQQQPSPQPKPKKTKRRSTQFDGSIGDWQRLLEPLAANSGDLPQLEIPRAQLAALLGQAMALKKQQAAHRATKQEASQQLRSTMSDGHRLAALLRQALKQHYGPRSEKLAEFGLEPFRGRAKSAQTPAGSPGAGTPPPEVVANPPAASSAAPKATSDPAGHS